MTNNSSEFNSDGNDHLNITPNDIYLQQYTILQQHFGWHSWWAIFVNLFNLLILVPEFWLAILASDFNSSYPIIIPPTHKIMYLTTTAMHNLFNILAVFALFSLILTLVFYMFEFSVINLIWQLITHLKIKSDKEVMQKLYNKYEKSITDFKIKKRNSKAIEENIALAKLHTK